MQICSRMKKETKKYIFNLILIEKWTLITNSKSDYQNSK